MTPVRDFPPPPAPPRTVVPITYRLAQQADYARCHALAREVGYEGGVYQYPTMLVERGGVLLGFAASRCYGQRLTLGPVVMRPELRTKGQLMLRACLGLEAVYRQAGITSYLLGSSDAGAQRVIEAFGCARVGEHQGEVWYIRRLTLDILPSREGLGFWDQTVAAPNGVLLPPLPTGSMP